MRTPVLKFVKKTQMISIPKIFGILMLLRIRSSECEWKSNVGSSNSIFVSKCLYSDISNKDGKGGSLCLEMHQGDLYIEESTFFNCSSIEDGGAMYILLSGQHVFYLCYVCGAHCISGPSKQGQFGCFLSENKNESLIECISIAACSHHWEGKRSICFSILGGNQSISNLNCSSCRIHSISSLSIESTSFFSGEFLNIVDNYAESHMGILLGGWQSAPSISYMNCVRNCSPLLCGILCASGGVKGYVSQSVFVDNDNTLFFTSRLSIMFISNSSVRHSDHMTDGKIELIYMKPDSLPTIAFSHYSTYFCFAEAPIQIPVPTKAANNYYGKFILYGTIIYVLSLLIIVRVVVRKTKRNIELQAELDMSNMINADFG